MTVLVKTIKYLIENKKPKGKNMSTPTTNYSPEVMALAKKNAEEMLVSGETIRKVQFGHETGFFYLSREAEKVIFDKEIEVGGKTFYIGVFNK